MGSPERAAGDGSRETSEQGASMAVADGDGRGCWVLGFVTTQSKCIHEG